MSISLAACLLAAHARKGQALEKLGRVDEARTHYQQCIQTLEHNAHFKEALQKLDAARDLAEQTSRLQVC